MKYLWISILGMLGSCLLPAMAGAENYETSIQGEGRVRWEYKNNKDYVKDNDDRDDFVGSRFRVNLNIVGQEGTELFIQPQATRTWGATDFDRTGTTSVGGETVPTGSEKTASGGLKDSEFSIHQAYLRTQLGSKSALTLGRQELAYGDHLVVGNVGWSNVGRSFDAIKIRTEFGSNWIDMFWSEVVESSDGLTDHNFAGIYSNLAIEALNAFELYVLYDQNKSGSVNEILTYGNRIEWRKDQMGLNLEYTGQSEDGFQADTTFHHKWGSQWNFGVGYFYANADYNQLFPTAHKWLGIADFFSRRNVQGARAYGKYSWSDQVTGTLSFHQFNRVSTDDPAYSFNGSTIGTGAEEGDHIADEVDLSINFKPSASVSYSLGGAVVLPGDYTKNAGGGDDSGEFVYLSVLVKL